MLLQLDGNFKITCDSSKQNLQLEMLQDVLDKKTKEVVRKDWNVIGFHGNSMRSVLLQYKNECLVNSQLESINDVLDRLNEIDRTIDTVVKRENIRLETKSDD
jgi:RNA binding exosome subunit